MSAGGNGGSGRDKVLGKVRASLGAAKADTRREAVAMRLKRHPRGLIPARALKPRAELRAMFKKILEGQSATVIDVDVAEDVAGAIASYLRAHNLPARVRSGSDPWLDGLGWQREPALERLRGRADAEDAVGLSRAVAGVAETGTLVLMSGADNPVTLNYLPETHIVVIPAESLVGPYEEAFDTVRRVGGKSGLSRTVNFVSGPSRTADIEATLTLGAHGPRRLCVIIVGRV